MFVEGDSVLSRSSCRSEDNIKLIEKNMILGLKKDYVSLNKDHNTIFYNLIS